MKFHRDLLIRSTSKLSLKIYFFAIFLVPSWFLRSMGAVPQNWLIPQKFHKKQSCRVSKSKIIMCLWSVALKARKAAKWPRTFYMVWTVAQKTKKLQGFWFFKKLDFWILRFWKVLLILRPDQKVLSVKLGAFLKTNLWSKFESDRNMFTMPNHGLNLLQWTNILVFLH